MSRNFLKKDIEGVEMTSDIKNNITNFLEDICKSKYIFLQYFKDKFKYCEERTGEKDYIINFKFFIRQQIKHNLFKDYLDNYFYFEKNKNNIEYTKDIITKLSIHVTTMGYKSEILPKDKILTEEQFLEFINYLCINKGGLIIRLWDEYCKEELQNNRASSRSVQPASFASLESSKHLARLVSLPPSHARRASQQSKKEELDNNRASSRSVRPASFASLESSKHLAHLARSVQSSRLARVKRPEQQSNIGGNPPPKYKSTGRIVCIMYKKRKYKRTVYVKDKRNTKYCKIDGEYILLSKMKVI